MLKCKTRRVVLSFLAGALCFFGVSASAQAGSIGLDPLLKSIGVGEIFDLNISLTGDTNLSTTSSMLVGFSYDPSVIDPLAATGGTFFTSTSSSATTSFTKYLYSASYAEFEVEIENMSINPSTFLNNELFATVSIQGVAPGLSLIELSGSGQGGCCSGDDFFDFSLDTPAEVTVNSAAVPLPAAFPLFATGLGALGLLGWRRKRKAAALAA